MQNVSEEMWLTWELGEFVGDNRPVTRAIISKQTLRTSQDVFRTLLHEARVDNIEIPSIKTITVDRQFDTDAAQMTMTVANSAVIDVMENLDESYDGATSSPTKRELGEMGSPGVYTYRRGLATTGGGEPNPWGHDVSTTWVDMFLPNRLIRTYQGYGTDGSPNPWDDTKLTQTGTWLIDRVEINTDGIITVTCRDMAKLLIEQRLYPPIVPFDNYPLNFCGPYKKSYTETDTTITGVDATLGEDVAYHISSGWDSSAAPWYGYNASVYGHRASHSFDGDLTTYWISMRNSKPSEDWSYEWIGADTKGEPVSRVKFKPWKGGYTAWIGVKVDGVWQGTSTVPYNKNALPAYPNGSNIKYLKKINVPKTEDWVTVDLDEMYAADEVRVVFTDLQWFGRIAGGDYRAGVYELQCYAYTPSTKETVTTDYELIKNEDGNTEDYTDIVKMILAWSGWYWKDGRPHDELLQRDVWGGKGGRVWGDFFYSGAYPIEPPCIDASYWDNKSAMDGINQIKEILGFVAYVDVTGGFIWRPPNIWRNGNFVTGLGYRAGEGWIREVSEKNVLIDYGVTVDDSALRSEVVVVSSDDPGLYGSYKPSHAEGEEVTATIDGAQIVTDLSLLAGQQRVMLGPDYPFGQDIEDATRAQAEVEKFAYLVTLWIHWSYRKSSFKIPGMPALEPDDQIRIMERTTSESYIHYIVSTKSTMDLDAGTYYTDIDTHWLGNGPDQQWHMYVNDMSPALAAYLCSVGQLPPAICGEEDSPLPEGWGDWSPVEIPDPLPRDIDDLQDMFPGLPDIVIAPPDYDYNDAYPGTVDGYPDGTVSPPGEPGSGNFGAVLDCTNAWMFEYWTGAGPGSGNCCLSGKSRRFFAAANGTGTYTDLDNRVWPAYNLLSKLFIRHGVEVSSGGGCVCRHIGNDASRPWSNHAWGVASDLNYWLSWGTSIRAYSADIRDPYLDVGRDIGTIRSDDGSGRWDIPVFKWGEDFSFKDPMHWQVCCDPRYLARGVTNVKYTTDGPI